MNELKKKFLEQLKALNYSKNTIRAYKNDLSSLDNADYDSVITALEGLNPHSKQRRLVTFNKFFEFACNNGLEENPVKNFGSIRTPKKIVEIPDIDESHISKVENLLHKAVLKLLVEDGLRASEFTALSKSCLSNDSHGLWLKINQAKGYKDRLVPLQKDTYKMLSNLFNIGKKFPESRGIYYIAKKYFDTNPHAIRRYCFTKLSEKGMSPFILMKIAGWSNIEVAMHYVNVSQGSIWKEFERCMEKF